VGMAVPQRRHLKDVKAELARLKCILVLDS
jgi:hypothetical protein